MLWLRRGWKIAFTTVQVVAALLAFAAKVQEIRRRSQELRAPVEDG